MDLRWNRLGNSGAKAILKGLNLNKTLNILELAGNKVSDDYLRQINDFLNRNQTGEHHIYPSVSKQSLPNYIPQASSFQPAITSNNVYISPSKKQ